MTSSDITLPVEAKPINDPAGAHKENVDRDILDLEGNTEAAAEDEPEEPFRLSMQHILAIMSFQFGYMSDVFILTMASSILLQINEDIGPSTDYTWMANAQTLSAAVLSPFVGRLSDIFGRRNFLLLGNVLSVIGCLISATTHRVDVVIGGAAFIGAGSSMHQLAWSALSEMVPRKSRSVALGIFMMSISVTSSFGALIAYVMVKHTTWRDIYWFAFSLNASATVLVFFFYKTSQKGIRDEGLTTWQSVKQLDILGFFLFLAGLVLFLLGISFGGNQFPWKSAGTLAPTIIGLVLLIALGVWESYTTCPFPLFPKAVLKKVRGFTVVIAVVFLVGMVYYSTAVLWPQQVQRLYTTSYIGIGLYSCTLSLSGAVFAPVAGYVFVKLRHARILFTVSVVGLTICAGAQASVSPTSYVGSTVLVAIIGALLSSITIISTTMAQLGVPHEYIGVASGLAITSRSVGGTIATVVYSAVLQNDVSKRIGPVVGTALAEAGLPSDEILNVLYALVEGRSSALASVSPSIIAAGEYALKLTYAHAFKLVYLISIAFGGAGILCAVFSLDVDHLMTSKVDVTMANARPENVKDTADVESEKV
ncbi:trichothecene efflux pump [Kockiozyma suomiensis]|uniref:trichothecene efflux pump n=1 Tax=Kockiozyma suomiensis TaxID=1337062 RepID=UPI00334375DF